MNRDNHVKRKIHPRETANTLSVVFFFYIIGVFKKGYKKSFQPDDLYEVLKNCGAKENGDQLEIEVNKLKTKYGKYSISRTLWACYGKLIMVYGFMRFLIRIFMTVWEPTALSKLISFFGPSQQRLKKSDAIYYAIVVISLQTLNLIVSQNITMAEMRLKMRMRAAIATLLYRKSLKLSAESLSEITVGKVTTIISKDLDPVCQVIACCHELWITTIETIVICCLIFNEIGTTALPGIVFIFVALPAMVYIGISAYKLRLKSSQKTDERLRLVQEVLSAVKIIKMHTWEKYFENKLISIRKEELVTLHGVFFTKVWIAIGGNLCSKMFFFIVNTTYVWIEGKPTAELVYYILSLCNKLESSLGSGVPTSLSYFSEALAACKRIDDVLNAKESISQSCKSPVKFEKNMILLEEVSIQIRQTTIFENVSLKIVNGLNIVVGPVGSGKTSFLKIILGEYPVKGRMDISGIISYASQEAWLFPSTIRNNIVFGEEFCVKRYQEVLKVCSLDFDLQLLSNGDATMVGERGINLSKGQQARINLARAVYRKSDIYLFDDCLASLDGQVADSIFEECLRKFLNHKICVFVTNSVNYVRKANCVISCEEKNIKLRHLENRQNTENKTSVVLEDSSPVLNISDLNREVYYENKRTGRVSWKIYYRYIAFGGVPLFSLVLMCYSLTQFVSSYSEKLMSDWITLQQNLLSWNGSNSTDYMKHKELNDDVNKALILYVIFAALSILLVILRSVIFLYFVRLASNNLHKAMVRSIIRSTMEFFDTHYTGTVLNRFSKDYVSIDEYFPFVFGTCIWTAYEVFGGTMLLTSVTTVFLVELLSFLSIGFILKVFCTPAIRDSQRLVVQTNSPMIGQFNSTLEGLTTIRASNSQRVVTMEFQKHQDLASSAFYLFENCLCGFIFLIDLFSILFVVLVIVQLLTLDLGTSVGEAGLAITQALSITNMISSALTHFTDLEGLMTSVERILEYTDTAQENQDGAIPPCWPKNGSIQYQRVSLNYGSTPQATLKEVSFFIKPEEKFGLVGRTGAGKSSIISALIRLYPITGKIVVDGIDIAKIPLNCLRSNISVISQDPFLFCGTIRENIDPLAQYTDEQIWNVFNELKLQLFISDLNEQIDKGTSLSVGQKQLLCLARVILRKNKIVVLDEATANVDEETENIMLKAIEGHFSGCTVIIVAHRLRPVTHCDKVIVMSEGRIKDFDTLVNLMKNDKRFMHHVLEEN